MVTELQDTLYLIIRIFYNLIFSFTHKVGCIKNL